MASNALSRFFRLELAPPAYLSMPAAGFAVSASGVHAVVLKERVRGLAIRAYGEEPLPLAAIEGGEYSDRAAILAAVRSLARKLGVRFANIALPEAHSYLFETEAEGADHGAWIASVAPRIDQLVPLPPADTAFDLVPTPGMPGSVTGVGYATRVVDEALSVFDATKIGVRAVESEMFALARAVVLPDDARTALIIDIGRTTTKLGIVQGRVPRFATTLDVGGHAFTQAAMKRFGVAEDEALRMVRSAGMSAANPDSREALLSSASAIKDEVLSRVEYWQSRATAGSGREPIAQALLVGGDSPIPGLAEYLKEGIGLPMEFGNVWTNLVPRSRSAKLSPEGSLGYAAAIGLALRDYDG